jgi:hypothetical protein
LEKGQTTAFPKGKEEHRLDMEGREERDQEEDYQKQGDDKRGDK